MAKIYDPAKGKYVEAGNFDPNNPFGNDAPVWADGDGVSFAEKGTFGGPWAAGDGVSVAEKAPPPSPGSVTTPGGITYDPSPTFEEEQPRPDNAGPVNVDTPLEEGQKYYTGTPGISAVPGVDAMINRDAKSWEARLRAAAAANGVSYEDSDLGGVIRQVSYSQNANMDPDTFLREAEANYARRGANNQGTDANVPGQSSPYKDYIETQRQPSPTQQGLPAGAQTASTPGQQAVQDNPQLQALLDQITAQQAQQDQQREAMRTLLMEQIGQASTPVSQNDPGIREILAAQRLSGQRMAERQRSQQAVGLAGNNLQSSGAADNAFFGIDQARGEQEMQGVASVMGQALERKSAELRQLMTLAIQSGDAEAARTLQAQISALDAQLQQQRITNQGSQFGQSMDFNKSSFLDNLGYKLLALQLSGNQTAGQAFL